MSARTGTRAGPERSTLQEAKDRVRIPDLWREFGYEGEPRKSCFCPLGDL
jgi:hypothetical protein